MNRITRHFAFLFWVVLLAACSHIDESERLIYVKPAPAERVVLLEDFTGQRCPNCPRGTEIIEQLQAEFGDSVVIAVGIHGGPLGFAGRPGAVGLATDVGNEYYAHWQLEYQPVGLVNRHGAVNYPDWTRTVREELQKTAPLQLRLGAVLHGDQVDIAVEAMGTDGSTSGRLQVWLLEDSITAMQLMPDGKRKDDYVHNHVLRTPVNGAWGDEFAVAEGETSRAVLSQTVDEAWNRRQLSVVAFVYDGQGVQQAVRARVTGVDE